MMMRGRFDDAWQDIWLSLRQLRRAPTFSGLAVLTLALGIGASTAIFSIVDDVLLAPLPYPDADRIVVLRTSNAVQGYNMPWVSPDDYLDWKERSRSLEQMGMYRMEGLTYTGGDRPLRVRSYLVTDGLLRVLGGNVAHGRTFADEEYVTDNAQVLLLTYGFWERVFGGDPNMVGRSLTLDGLSYSVAGILAEDWEPIEAGGTDVVIPWRWDRGARRNGANWVRVVGRRRADVAPDVMQAELSSISADLAAAFPSQNQDEEALAIPLYEELFGPTRPQLFMFLASALLVLLIACVNVANMTLSRSVTRGRELTVRAALGAGRARLFRQLLTESVVLAGIGGLFGCAVAVLSVHAFSALAPPELIPRMNEIGIDPLAIGFAAGISLVSGVLFGALPAMALRRSGIESGGFGGERVVGAIGSRMARNTLVVAEVGLSVVLLVGSGLLLKSLSAIDQETPGFATADRLAFAVPLSETDYPDASAMFAYAELAMDRLGAIPGVESIATTPALPIWGGWDSGTWGVQLDGEVIDEDAPVTKQAHVYRVKAGHLETMGIPLISGRDLQANDGLRGQKVALVSESFVREHFPDGSPLGHTLRLGGSGVDAPWAEIIGVAGEVQAEGLGVVTPPQVYVPLDQQARSSPTLWFVVRSSLPSTELVNALRVELASIDPNQPMLAVDTFDDLMGDLTARHRFRALLMTGFGAVSLLLAMVGVYGALSFAVSQRTREIGVRMALGASRDSVLAMIVRGGAPLVLAGIVGGLCISLAFSRTVESMLYGVAPRDASVFVGAAIALSCTALIAMLVPARRAARLDPLQTLKEES
jgi:putative ABC transport system permease protein